VQIYISPPPTRKVTGVFAEYYYTTYTSSRGADIEARCYVCAGDVIKFQEYVCAAGVRCIEGARRAQLLTASSIIIIFSKLCSRERTHRRRGEQNTQYGRKEGLLLCAGAKL